MSWLASMDVADWESEQQWERKHGSGPAGTSQADVLQGTAQGREKLREMREALRAARLRKAQVDSMEGGYILA